MKKYIPFFMLTIALASLAVVASAYSSRPVFPASTDVVPVTTGDADQTKTGGLSVDAFVAKNAEFKDMIMVEGGVIRGGTIGNTNDSTVYFGDWATQKQSVSIVVASDAKTNTVLTSDILQGVGERPTCADSSGMISICE